MNRGKRADIPQEKMPYKKFNLYGRSNNFVVGGRYGYKNHIKF